jgi:hypothetical protein
LLDLLFDTINLLRDYVWGGIAAVVAIILILTLGFLAKTIHSSRTSDLTRDELRLLKAFNEQAKENRSRDLSVEFAVYKAEVDEYEIKLQRLKALGYLRDSNIKGGYLGHRPVRITAKGMRRAEKRR